MSIAVGRLEPFDQWDQNLLDRLFANTLYPTGLNFTRHDGYPKTTGCVLLIPGRYWVDQTDEMNKALAKYKWVLAIRTSDEADSFDISLIKHPNIKWWVQTPRPDRRYGESRLLGVGFSPHFNDLPAEPPNKDIDVFLAGQNTHTRRRDAFAALARVEGTVVSFPTPGFTQGMSPEDYRDHMLRARVAPAPAGIFSPDSFRAYEALEAHAVPIADDLSPVYDSRGYWNAVVGTPPFSVITDYNNLPGWINDTLVAWPGNANRIVAWWMRLKRTYAQWLVADLTELGALDDDK